MPPVLLEKMRPKLAVALQQAAALAVKATEERAELALRAALKKAEEHHANQLSEVMHSAQKASQREREDVKDKMLEVTKLQTEERIVRAVAAARLEEARKFELEKQRAIQETMQVAQRQAETAKKVRTGVRSR